MSQGTRVYIGRLPQDVRKGDLEDLFRDYGRLQDVRIMGTFGFVEFEHPRDAEDAVKDYDGKNFMGERIVVQHAKGARREADPYSRGPPGGGYGSRGGSDYGSGYGGAPARREPRIRRGQFRCIVSNLPPNTSWQDLKDIGREHGSISFADVDSSRPDQGSIEYDNREDYERALDKIEGTELRGYKLRIDPAEGGAREDRERSPSRRRDDSPPRRRDDSPPRRRDDSPPPRRRDDSREPREEAREPAAARNGGGWDSQSPPPAGDQGASGPLDD